MIKASMNAYIRKITCTFCSIQNEKEQKRKPYQHCCKANGNKSKLALNRTNQLGLFASLSVELCQVNHQATSGA